jgi:hypothetical protein
MTVRVIEDAATLPASLADGPSRTAGRRAAGTAADTARV